MIKSLAKAEKSIGKKQIVAACQKFLPTGTPGEHRIHQELMGARSWQFLDHRAFCATPVQAMPQ